MSAAQSSTLSASATVFTPEAPISSTATWSLPPTTEPRLVLPDRYTDPAILDSGLIGKEVDPGRMGIYICLLDERPHLHPSLAALNKHRLQAHSIPLPPDPTRDYPVQSGLKVLDHGWTHDPQSEWITWRFTEEEEARRRAYLPLS